MQIKTLPQNTKELLRKYQNLPDIGINTPYYINKSQHHFEPAIKVGKGSIEEIVKELKQLAAQSKLSKPTQEEWAKIAKENKIGIDCSGLITRLLVVLKSNNPKIQDVPLKKLMKARGSLLNQIARFINFEKNLNSNNITNDLNTIKISNVKDIQIGDLIRFSGGAHVGLISKLVYDDKDLLKEIYFVHSTEGAGVSEDKIIVKDENKGLSFQEWEPNPKAIRQPEYLYKRRINNNGIRRLKFLQQ